MNQHIHPENLANPEHPIHPTQLSKPITKNEDAPSIAQPTRWSDPLGLIQREQPSHIGRIVLYTVAILISLLIIWAAIGKLDIIATAEGKLTPQTLLKIVQPAEAGVVREIMINEGDVVQQGQILARFDTTLAHADYSGVEKDIATQRMQIRRIQAELSGQEMTQQAADAAPLEAQLYAQIQLQSQSHNRALQDSISGEQALLTKAMQEHQSALQVQSKLQQTLPDWQRSADAYSKLEQQGFISALGAAEKKREATEKSHDLEAQHATVASLQAAILASQKRIAQLQSQNTATLQNELADTRAKLEQLLPVLEKNSYHNSLMELKAPQAGIIKDLATTTLGAVVQPGTVMMTLVPKNEQLYADVAIKNEDVGFVHEGQSARIKLATYTFQKYGMLSGKVTRISVDATDAPANKDPNSSDPAAATSSYKARIQLDQQALDAPQGLQLKLMAGMQVVAEIHQGQRTVLEYLLSPVQKAVQEAGTER